MSPAKNAAFAIGVDLGTTNCALASTPLDADPLQPPVVDVLNVPQVVNPGELEERNLLPSFIYLPSEHELPPKAVALPWDSKRDYAAGVFARAQGARVPGRLVHSAKSWLGVSGGEGPRAAILPWQAPEGVPKISPVDASARYLAHLREAWDAAHKGKNAAPLGEQELVLTVPASFDASARELTAEAAKQAGYTNLTLLEEPQAALYAWLAAQGDGWRKHLKAGDVLLVVDVGGGTSDFSLIAVGEEGGNLTLNRIAVGDHILLGGDNMDLALAYAIKGKLEAAGKTIDAAQMNALTFACRDAKEALFSKADLKSHPIAIAGRGASLMASTIRTELDRATLLQVLVDGFLPQVGAETRPVKARRTGLATLGLPYAQDAGITRHMAEFLGRQVNAANAQQQVQPAPGATFLHPTCVLFNGGVFKAAALQERVVEVLNGWLKSEKAPELRVLSGQDLDFAVARGAAAYARYRAAGGLRIRGGTARAYYVGIELSAPAVPGVEPPLKAVCIAPFGMEEGTREELPQELGLVTGEPARFRFFASTVRREDKVGTEVSEWKDELVELPSIEATATGSTGEMVPVRIRSHVTPIGTLELSCADKKGDQRARFEFNVRAED